MHLRALRDDANLTQEQVAKELGISRTSYTKYESGQHEPPFDLLIGLAKLFNVSTDYILGYEGVCAYSFFNNLRIERERTGKSIAHVAACVDVSEEEYRKYEDGTAEPSMLTLSKIAIYFCTTTDYLTGLDRSEFISKTGEIAKNIWLNRDEMEFVNSFRRLNDEGREKLLSYADDLVESGKYRPVVKKENAV